MKKSLTIVVDMLNGFAKVGPLADKNIKDIIPEIKNVLEKSENILFINDSHSPNDLEMAYYPDHCLTGTYEAEIVDELKPYANWVLTKNTTNAFWDIPLKTWFDYDEFIIVGCCTDICVLGLSISAKTFLNQVEKQKAIKVKANACATFDKENHDAKEFHKKTLEILKLNGIEII
ncbi:cysteine hydrolase [[Mycoplasma] falconis]|uniref:Cysteine hydrolase n=1 Tax=[Mycoplasma] falconis TaxID=92403 RepID=A0A501X9W0_9BACT|nr:isochorismatase family cysteine hydrolase [[Mycoplasma] falconis]TPE57157.1 cysteine hydrolase [[Mycoplasma] falconis]